MAEFKLGRIKFVWQGDWAADTNYVVDDVVSNAGKSWICVVNHTSSSLFVTDSDHVPPKWHLVSDGLSWRGNWATSTYYNVGDQVKYGGNVYVAKTAHTSAATTTLGLEADQDLPSQTNSKWDLVASSFYWTGVWTTNHRYRVNDFVVYGGTTYFCNTAHTSAATDTLGLEDNQAYWTAFNNGIVYLGEWTDGVRYKLNDVVKYGSGSWICIANHTSDTVFDDAKFSVFVEGLQFEDSWNPGMVYQIGDIVTYGGYSYIAKRNNTSSNPSTGPEAALDWQLYTTGFNFTGDWSSSTTYKVGDVVRLGGYTYLAIADSSNQTPPNGAYWNELNSGFNWTSQSSSYPLVSGVTLTGIGQGAVFNIASNGTSYSATVQTTGINYAVGDTILVSGSDVGGLSPINDVVLTVDSILGVQLVDGSAYVNGTNLTIGGNNSTTSPLFLDLYLMSNAAFTANFVTGSQFRLDANSKTAVFEVSTITTLTATDVQVDLILVSGDQTVITTDLTNAGVTFTFLVEEPASIGPIVAVSAAGYAVTWSNGASYVKGDIAFFGANSYVCIQAHIASSTNRPDQDEVAAYWNVLAAGSESAVLTTEGDTYYFGANGPSRLPIGTDGQLLRVKGGYPAWSYFGVINNVVYVAPTGVDDSTPGRGLTIDKPWRTMRYACTQVDRGYLNSNAVELLKKNKQFIMKEISNWVTKTYSVEITAATASTAAFTATSTSMLVAGMPIEFSGTTGGVTAGTKYFVKTVVDDTHFTISSTQGGIILGLTDDATDMTGALSYDYTFCQRDVGILVDALVFDMSHGGNEYSTNAAKAYYTTAGSAYINSNFGQQIVQTVAAYNYLKSLVTAVISNAPPAINYQEENGLVNYIVSQTIDTSLAAEEGATDLAVTLLNIVTDGISAGSKMAIPAPAYANTTISVKTGTYVEVLPIVIPNHTALVGDELRSVTTTPNSAITNLVNDKPKTISALNRIKGLLPNLVSNNTIEVSAGNTAEQQYVYQANESIATSSVRTNVTTAKDILTNGSTSVPVTITDPANLDTGYFNARRLINLNKDFLKAEAIAYVNYNFVNFDANYDSATCARDVGMIIDAVCYDLVTGSNFASSVAGEAYYRSQSALVPGAQLFQTLDVIQYVKSATAAYITNATLLVKANAAFDNVYNILANGLTAIPTYTWPDNGTSTTPGGTVEDAALLQTNRATLVSGVTTYLSTTSPYDTVYNGLNPTQQAQCARDIGYVIDALTYDLQYGGNYQTITAGLAYYSGAVLQIAGGEKAATLAAYTELGTLIKGYTSSTGDTTIDSLISVLNGIINSGSAPSYVYPSASGESTAVQSTLSTLQSAKNTIKSNTTSYITATFNGLVYDSDKCQRDIGYIVDALAYDLTYGGNLATQIAARSYYTKGTLVEPTGEKKAALATQLRLKSIISSIAQGVAITPTSGNAASQDTSGTAGSSTAGSFAAARINEVYNTINTGTTPTAIAPSLSSVNPNKVSALTGILAAKTSIQERAINWVTTNYPLLDFDQSLCSRDVGYIVEALAYDMVFDSNFLTQWNALSYYRGLTSTGVVIADQKQETINLMPVIGLAVIEASFGTDVLTTNVNTMSAIIANGLSAVPTYTLPTPTGGSYGYTSGYFNAARLVYANRQFIMDEVQAYMVANQAATWNGLSSAQKVACTRDIGYIVDALRFDLTYGGNLATVIAARSYYTNGSFVELSGEKTAALAAQTYLKSFIDNIVTGDNAGWTKLNSGTQVVSGTAGSAPAATFAQARIQEMYDCINTGTTPTTINPDTSWVDTSVSTLVGVVLSKKTKIKTTVKDWIDATYPELIYNAATCQRDAGYIVDALSYDYMFGSNFLSCWNAMSYYRALTSTGVVLAQQLEPTLGTVGVIAGQIKEVLYMSKQSLVGNVGAINWVETSANTIYDIVSNGLDAAPAEIITDPSTLDSNFRNARTQIANNYAFIKADVSQYIANNYNAVWVALGATGQAACQRDVGYILDAIRYDLTYGGNTQSLIAGRAYWSGIARTINSTELTATNAAYTYLKSIIDDIAKKLTVTPQAGNSTPQVVSGTGDLVGTAATFAQSRVQDVIDYIASGTSPTTIDPATDWVDVALSNGFLELQTRKTEIQNDALGYVQKFFQSMDYDEVTCARDVGYMVDAIGYDMMFGSNVAAITVGRSYHRAISSAQLVMASQKDASLGLVKFLKYKIKGYATGGAVAKAGAVIDDIIGTIDGGAVPRMLWPSFTGIDAENYAAAKLIFDNKKFIQAETLKYINNNYPAVEYNRITCARDVGYIVDAVRYDLTYGGNFASRQAGIAYYSQLTNALQIDSNDKTATLAAYGNLKTLLQDIANGGLSSYTPLQSNVSYIIGSAGDSASATAVGALIDAITTTITSGIASAPAETLPSTSWVSTDLVTQASALVLAKSTVQAAVTNYIGTNYPNLSYDSTTCERDVGYIIDALAYDMMLGSNFRSIKAGMSYYQAQASKVLSGQKRATLNAYRFLKDTLKTIVVAYAPAVASVSKNMSIIIDIIDKGVGETPDVNGSVTYLNDVGNATAVEILRANKSFLENESTAWIKRTFGGNVSGTLGTTITTTGAHNLTIGDPVQFTGPTVSTTATDIVNDVITVLSTEGMVVGSKIVFMGTMPGSIVSGTTYYIRTIESATTITISSTYGGDLFAAGNGTGTLSVTAGGLIGSLAANTQYYVLTTPTASTFTITATLDGTTPVTLTTDTGTCRAVYSFDEVSCKRDMGEYVEALINDLQYPGNHKGTYAALVYNNAVAGSEASDMFWVSNSSGLRNMTLTGLSGDLTELNNFGTRRPTAGAFVALNPGFGPMDSRVWVTSRSHYSQNVTMFGAGCTGAKIDAALHRYGYKSMVKNDFTTIISDGIGVWCTGQDSLTELVSVFNYYGYSGYLAELGGRIRATNGNSSYGTYGVIAEGVDVHEAPIYGAVDNQANQAQVTDVVTDGVTQVLRMEFGNAGTGYTNASYTLSGAGYNAAAVGDEFRDSSVFETRIIDLNDSNGVGGTSYVTQSNAAQTGDTTTVTIAATDTALSNAYNGMRIQLLAGTGAGQYANILTYAAGSKIATVYKDSFTTLTVTATAITNNLLTVASTATLYPGMPIYLTSAANGLSANTLYYVRTTGFTTTQFSVSTTDAAGTAVTITATGSVSLPLLAAGWDHAVPGTAIELALDLTTQYIIEPKINYTAPGYSAVLTSTGLGASAWSGLTYGDNKFVAISDSDTVTRYTTDGASWTTAGNLPSADTWNTVVYGGGSGAAASITIGGLGGQGAVLQAVLGVPNTTGAATADQIASVTVVNGGAGYTTAPVIVFTPVSGGAGAVATCAVLNGAIVSVTVTVPGSGYTVAPTVTAATDRITIATVNDWGKNYFGTPSVTVSDPFSGSAWSSGGTATLNAYYYYVNTGVKYWYQATVAGTFTTTGPVHTSGSASNGTATLTYVGTTAILTPTMENAGVKSLAITNSGKGYTTTPTVTILDTAARYVAIANNGVNCYTTSAGISAGSAWTAGTTISGSPTINSLAYGNGVYVAVGGTSSAASSTNGNTWTVRTIPTLGSGTYSDVAFGNGTFVAISMGNVPTAVSANGTSWVAGGNLPSASNWISVAYGNGRFVAIAMGTRNVAISIDNGVTWTAVTPGLPSIANWTSISYGQGVFMAVNGTNQYCAISPDGINWTPYSRAGLTSSNPFVQFGNPGNTPVWISLSPSAPAGAVAYTGAQATGRVKVTDGQVTEIRMVEPGSGYPKGVITAATGGATNSVTTSNTTNLVDSQPVEFTGCSTAGLTENVTYYVIGSTIVSNTSFKVSATAGSSTPVNLNTVSGLTGTYRAGPIVTVTDPNKVKTVATRVRLGDGALGNPSFSNRGTDMATATSEVTGDGYSNLYQPSSFINVSGLYDIPEAGANVEFASLPGVYFKLVSVVNALGSLGNKTATFQINPALSVLQAPAHGDVITTRLKYSQVRLTGHDFLYIGTGGREKTNYPNVDISTADTANQTVYSAGGRVFFTSTDQDGNFNVGNLFGVQQATGTATLNASAFNLSGLNSLQLGSVELGIGSAIITQFSTDPFFTADSDNIVPTQRAIKAYITSQIGGGQSSLNVNTLTSGIVYIAGNTITTTTGEAINVTTKMNFTGGIDGAPVALGFFMQR